MKAHSKLAAIAVCFIFAWAARASSARSSRTAGSHFVQYTIDPNRDAALSLASYTASTVADISPDSPNVAVLGWAANAGGNPNHIPLIIPIYDYRQADSGPELLREDAVGALMFSGKEVPPVSLHAFIRYGPDGRFLLVYDGQGTVYLLPLQNGLPPVARKISLGLSADRPTFQPVDIEWSPDGKRFAVILSFKIFHEGVVRVYDVATGRLQWERNFNFVEMGGEAWGPNGRRLAVTILTGQPNTAYAPRDIPNLLVLDANSGRTLVRVTTGDSAGPVCFAPDNTLVTAPYHFQPYGTDRWHHEKAKVWDATTGRLVRQIVSPGRDIHDDLELSKNGKILLAYVGKERSGFVWKYMEDVNEVLDRRFQLFDYATGKVIETSPDIPVGCGDTGSIPSFRLSAGGCRVLSYWPTDGCKVKVNVFELQ